MSVTIKTATLDGKQVAYSSDTRFHIQLGKGKSAYRNRMTIVGDLGAAAKWYMGFNVGYGYKKRLVMEGANKPVLARTLT